MAGAGGVVFALSTPPMDLTLAAWVGLVLFAYVLEVGPSETLRRAWWRGGGSGVAFGMGASLVAHRFVPAVIARFTPMPFAAGGVALVLLAVVEGVPWAMAGALRVAFVRTGIPRPLAFGAAMYGGCFVPTIFPWTPAAGFTRWPALLQLADVIGERGVAALLCVAAGCLASGLQLARADRRRALRLSAAAFALPLAMAAYGRVRMQAIAARRAVSPTARVGLIQPAVEATVRWDPVAAPGILAKLTELTRVAESHGARVSVWPESSYPYVLTRGSAVVPLGPSSPFQNGVHGPLILGAVTSDLVAERYNAVLGAPSAEGFLGEYDKLHLLWFGEAVPLAGSWPWLRRTFLRGVGMVPGDNPVRIDVGQVKAGILICFEDILPGAGREAAGTAPNLLVNVSNDAWFVGSAESELHMRMSSLRAIEARRDLVRAVNVGASALIDAAGRVERENDDPTAGAFVVNARLLEGPVGFYTAWGDGPTLALFSAILAVLGARVRRTKRNERRITS